MQSDNMVSERTAYATLLFVIVVGIALMGYGMWLSAGQHLNTPAIVGGIVVLAGLALMLSVSVSAFETGETTTHGGD